MTCFLGRALTRLVWIETLFLKVKMGRKKLFLLCSQPPTSPTPIAVHCTTNPLKPGPTCGLLCEKHNAQLPHTHTHTHTELDLQPQKNQKCYFTLTEVTKSKTPEHCTPLRLRL